MPVLLVFGLLWFIVNNFELKRKHTWISSSVDALNLSLGCGMGENILLKLQYLWVENEIEEIKNTSNITYTKVLCCTSGTFFIFKIEQLFLYKSPSEK